MNPVTSRMIKRTGTLFHVSVAWGRRSDQQVSDEHRQNPDVEGDVPQNRLLPSRNCEDREVTVKPFWRYR